MICRKIVAKGRECSSGNKKPLELTIITVNVYDGRLDEDEIH